ncbi:MAG: anaerobic sulfatase maturase [Halanaerobiaceae bacterium]
MIENKDATVKQSLNMMAFPAGPACNAECEYCYYLDKTDLYPGSNDFMMPEEIMEEYIRQYIAAHPGPEINFGWQGGEPLLRGLDFYKRAIECIEKYLPEGWEYKNTLQTNGILLDEKWARFLSRNNFLVGLSLDGPAGIHDKYRRDKNDCPTHARVEKGLKLLQEHDVDYNVLCVVNDKNSRAPDKVFHYFLDRGVEYMQFIPLVEDRGNGEVGELSVTPVNYGKFLLTVFEEWIGHLGDIFVQIFEECIRAWAGYPNGLCSFSETCGQAPVLEHNGDIYVCDHFVFPGYKLGNIKKTTIKKIIESGKLLDFGRAKKNDLPRKCRECDYNFICSGGCPKNRITGSGKVKLNYLCEGYRYFFSNIDPYMEEIIKGFKRRRPLTTIRKGLQKINSEIWNGTGRNDRCPCGSGEKYKWCCLDRK